MKKYVIFLTYTFFLIPLTLLTVLSLFFPVKISEFTGDVILLIYGDVVYVLPWAAALGGIFWFLDAISTPPRRF